MNLQELFDLIQRDKGEILNNLLKAISSILLSLIVFDLYRKIGEIPDVGNSLVFLSFVILFFLPIDLFIGWVVGVYKKRKKRYSFLESFSRNDWIIQGGSQFDYKSKKIQILNSDKGIILKNFLVKDFIMKFNAKYLTDQQHFGIIVEAIDTNNYLMIEIINKDKNIVTVKPHIRNNGHWEVVSEKKVGEKDLENPFEVELAIIENNMNLSIAEKFNYTWQLPNVFEDLIRSSSKSSNETMIGFRAFPGQGVEISNLEIIKT